MTDTWVERGAAEYAAAIASELPTGEAWSRDPDGGLMRWVAGCAQIWGDVAAAAALLLVIESDPRYTSGLLGDWERAFGLPDPCLGTTVLSLPERRAALVNKLTTQGGQSRAFFISVAAALGYAITITEFVPFQFGLSSFGGSHGAFAGPQVRFYWRVHVPGPRLTRFRFGLSSFGRDSFLEIVKAVDLECVFRRWSPAHTVILFDYADSFVLPPGALLDESGAALASDDQDILVAS